MRECYNCACTCIIMIIHVESVIPFNYFFSLHHAYEMQLAGSNYLLKVKHLEWNRLIILIRLPKGYAITYWTHPTGCKVRKAYTSLGTSCHNRTPDSNCCLLMHAVMQSIAIGSSVYTGVCIQANYNGNAYMHEQATIGIWCTNCGRKHLNWCTTFGSYSQWS